MPFSEYIKELQDMIAKFMDIHNNPHDTSGHNDKADLLKNLEGLLKTSTENTPKTTPPAPKPTNELGLTEEQVTDKLTNFFEAFDKITIMVNGTAVHVEVPYFINKAGTEHGAWDGATETAGKGTPEELRKWLQKEVDGGKTKAKDAAGLRAYMKTKKRGVDCSGFVSQALNHLADKDGDMDYDKDDAFKPDNTGSGSLKGGAKDFKKIDPANVKAGDTLFYDNKGGIDHIQIVADSKKEGDVVYYTIFESSGSTGPRKMDWKYENGNLYRKDGEKWNKKTGQHFGRWNKLEQTVPSGGEVVTDGKISTTEDNKQEDTQNTLSGSVGEDGDNIEKDVRLIQTLLNKRGAKLKVDGDCGNKTIRIIKKFQKKMGMKKPDGLIMPGKNTWKALNKGITEDTATASDDGPIGDDKPNKGAVPSHFVRMQNSEVTPELSKAAVHYLNVFTKKYPKIIRNKHYGEYIIFKTQDGKEFLAHFEVHEKYGADPSKAAKPHPSIGLFKNKNNDNPTTEDNPSGSIIDTIGDAIDTVIDTVSDFIKEILAGNKVIQKPVGEGGDNLEEDVKIVQTLLNNNGANPQLKVDGDCGKKSIAAIIAFQTKMGLPNPDGLISPNKNTWKALVKGITPVKTDPSDTTDTTQPVDEALSTTSKISDSVGHKGKNKPEDVVLVKKLLNKFGFKLEETPEPNSTLTEAIKKFQKEYRGSSNPDGRVDAGGKTWNTLLGIGRIKGDLSKVAKEYGVEEAVILAIQSIESGGNGFFSDGRPKILFEGHVFWSQLKKVGKDPAALQKGNENIIYPKWVKTHYAGGVKEYDRLEKAMKIDKIAALKSASWGEFQIMGFNHSVVGYSDVESFVDAMHQAGANQLAGLMAFLKNNNLLKHVQGSKKDWAALAKGYNGPAYAQNKYDVKLASAYARYAKLTL